MPGDNKDRAVTLEALLFAHGAPLARAALGEALGLGEAELAACVADLRQSLVGRGVTLVEGADGFELTVAGSERERVAQALAHTAQPLSQSAIEVLTIIAYRQPVAKPTIDDLRGVVSDAGIRTLLARDLIVADGAEDGSPTYRTTNHFLKALGLTDLSELPAQKGLK